MEKLTYREALKKTQQQTINLLHGEFVDNRGLPDGEEFIGGDDCYGCEYIIQNFDQYCIEHQCPTREIAETVVGSSVCNIEENNPEMVFASIEVINEILKEMDDEEADV